MSDSELRSRFPQGHGFSLGSHTLAREYALGHATARDREIVRSLVKPLQAHFPMFVLIDPADIHPQDENAKALSIWRRITGETRPPVVAPYHLLEQPADGGSLSFILALALRSHWRVCFWSMDAHTSVLVSELGQMHVNSISEALLASLDKILAPSAADDPAHRELGYQL